MATKYNRRSLCKFCDLKDWESAEFDELAASIMGTKDGGKFVHRKLWELVKCIETFQQTQVLHENAVGISIAAGCEKPIFFLANKVKRIVASDIYGYGEFSSIEAPAEFIDDPQRFAPYSYQQAHLRPVRLSAFNLKFPDNTFDFAFSLSSIEHFGGSYYASKALREMKRVVKPGGVIFITTECSINGHTKEEVFSIAQISKFAKKAKLQLMGPLNTFISDRSKELCLNMLTDDLTQTPHINLQVGNSKFTSYSLAFQKTGTYQPYKDKEVPKVVELIDSLVKQYRNTEDEYLPKDLQKIKAIANSPLLWLRRKTRRIIDQLQNYLLDITNSSQR